MKEPTFDRDGYPTEETLEAIQNWDYHDLDGLFNFIEEAWSYPEYFHREVVEEKVIVMMSTGGWSGNEDIIQAMKENFYVWALVWEVIKRGGHYTFGYTKRK